MKKCTRCKQIKTPESFYKDRRTSSGYYSACKTCHTKKCKSVILRDKIKLKPLPEDVTELIFTYIHSRIGKKTLYKNVKCEFSFDELLEFTKSNWVEYLELYSLWKKSNFKFNLVPSIDRIDPSLNYAINNIRYITQSENASRSHKGKKRSDEWKENISKSMKNYHSNKKLS